MKKFIFIILIPFILVGVLIYNKALPTFAVGNIKAPFTNVLDKVMEIPKVTWDRLWGMYEEYLVYSEDKEVADFSSYTDAVGYAKNHQDSVVYLKKGHHLVWSAEKRKSLSVLNIPVISQLPELPRGCEVTSLTMLLSSAGVETDKMTLAEKIKKDKTIPVQQSGTYLFFGNPHDGFVGDMYSFDRPGFGVYHEPVKDLAEKYKRGQIIDLTGADFEDLLFQLHKGYPVWVIVNTQFSKLGSEFFQTWDSPGGKVTTTFKEHSVLLTGYSKNYVYINDPLDSVQNKKIPLASFREAWEQMGRQGITYR